MTIMHLGIANNLENLSHCNYIFIFFCARKREEITFVSNKSPFSHVSNYHIIIALCFKFDITIYISKYDF